MPSIPFLKLDSRQLKQLLTTKEVNVTRVQDLWVKSDLRSFGENPVSELANEMN